MTEHRALKAYRFQKLQAVAQWEATAAERAEAYAAVAGGMDATGADAPDREFVAYVPLPEQEEIEARVRVHTALGACGKVTFSLVYLSPMCRCRSRRTSRRG